MPGEIEVLVLGEMLIGVIKTAYFVNASSIAARSFGSIFRDKSTSPISAAKEGVTGQAVMAMVVASRHGVRRLNHNGPTRAIE
jgi:hypothetical protein